MKKSPKNSKPKTAAQREIESLKRQIAEVSIQAYGYRRMIEIAELELGVVIRKSGEDETE